MGDLLVYLGSKPLRTDKRHWELNRAQVDLTGERLSKRPAPAQSLP
jgi:hypothetical protein